MPRRLAAPPADRAASAGPSIPRARAAASEGLPLAHADVSHADAEKLQVGGQKNTCAYNKDKSPLCFAL